MSTARSIRAGAYGADASRYGPHRAVRPRGASTSASRESRARRTSSRTLADDRRRVRPRATTRRSRSTTSPRRRRRRTSRTPRSRTGSSARAAPPRHRARPRAHADRRVRRLGRAAHDRRHRQRRHAVPRRLGHDGARPPRSRHPPRRAPDRARRARRRTAGVLGLAAPTIRRRPTPSCSSRGSTSRSTARPIADVLDAVRADLERVLARRARRDRATG